MLSPDKANGLNNLVVKELYTNKRARPDICTPVAFINTWVMDPETDYWKKLAHLMNYLRGKKIYHSSWVPVTQES